ncbi:hypothetical protein [Lysinibacillus halotolerans]|uniref:Uncharacterized protein n=1 Tax=Lysinibacillus halotolerans TaxID=1368476 RepID=A0A3M8HAT2_9BACI|nr:hypothetical protein [Lysinibacillus halotolerans]RNC99555.1 hypothetical protein EC501_07345 [Lysinibacillus halotolerans]
MSIEELLKSMNIGVEFKKIKSSSKILAVTKKGIKYSLGKNGNSKTVTFKELKEAIDELEGTGCISREWYSKKFPIQSKSAPCNYSTIGGLLMHVSYVSYDKGKYLKVE